MIKPGELYVDSLHNTMLVISIVEEGTHWNLTCFFGLAPASEIYLKQGFVIRRCDAWSLTVKSWKRFGWIKVS